MFVLKKSVILILDLVTETINLRRGYELDFILSCFGIGVVSLFYASIRVKGHIKRVREREIMARNLAEEILEHPLSSESGGAQGPDVGSDIQRLATTVTVYIIYGTKDCQRVYLWCIVHLWNIPFIIDLFISPDAGRKIWEVARCMMEHWGSMGTMSNLKVSPIQPVLKSKHKIVPKFVIKG